MMHLSTHPELETEQRSEQGVYVLARGKLEGGETRGGSHARGAESERR